MSSEPQWPSVEMIADILKDYQIDLDPGQEINLAFGASGEDPEDFRYHSGHEDLFGPAHRYSYVVTTTIDEESNCKAVAEWIVDQWNEYDIRSDSEENYFSNDSYEE